MQLEYADILADGLFAKRVVKTIQKEEFNTNSLEILNEVLTELKDSLTGKEASLKYTTDQNTLQTLRAYGKSISVIQSLKITDETDCVEKYVNDMISEVEAALHNQSIVMDKLQKTYSYYYQLRDSSIRQGSRFNMNIRTDDPWQIASKF